MNSLTKTVAKTAGRDQASTGTPPVPQLPSFDEMYAALCDRDSRYEGVFIVGVKSTGIFCRPTCSARKPKAKNATFFSNVGEAIVAGFRACKRCKPLDDLAATPDWVTELMNEIELDPSVRWTDETLSNRGIHPVKLRRWFKKNYGVTFQSYQRSRRLSQAAKQINGGDQIAGTAVGIGYESLSGFNDAFQKWCKQVPGTINTSAAPLLIRRITTPLGPMVAGVHDDSICLLEFADRKDLETQVTRLVEWTKRPVEIGNHELFDRLTKQLDEYFAGHRKEFGLPLIWPGRPFQLEVWKQLLKIPYGSVCSYQQIAKRVGRVGAQRAVGRANGSNRIAILIPCHRVVRSDGKPGGYAGELWRKQRLLDLESRLLF